MTFYDNQLKIAKMFEKIIVLNSYKKISDTAIALCENAIGTPINSDRNIDLCFGYGISSEPCQLPLKISPGIFRITNIDGQYLSTNRAPTVLDFHNLPVNENLNNVYVYGKIFAYTNTATSQVSTGYELCHAANGKIIASVRDIGIDEAFSCTSHAVQTVTGSTLNSDKQIEIYNFMLDIDNYYSNDQSNSIMKIYVEDVRKPRAWGGYADEVLFNSLLSEYTFYQQNAQNNQYSADHNIINLISTWISLKIWDVSFSSYWDGNGHQLPIVLKNFINLHLGLNL